MKHVLRALVALVVLVSPAFAQVNDPGGIIRYTPPSGGSSGITSGTTTITGGTAGYVLWNNAGTADATAGAAIVSDAFTVAGSVDGTKKLRFEVDGFTAGATRVATFPDANITVARTDAAQTFTGNQTFSGNIIASGGGSGLVLGGSAVGGIIYGTGQTPDQLYAGTGSLSNAFKIGEYADVAADTQNCSAGTSFSTNPLLCIQSADGTSTTKWVDVQHNGTNAVINSGTGGVVFAMTGSMGWSIVSAANQACTTTCTSAAVFGFDGTTPVGPADATADTCLCAGAN